MKTNKIFCLLILGFLSIATSFGQSKSINGKVLDSNTKEPLAFASISIINSLEGTMTELDGSFSIKLDESQDSIQVSYIGYEDKALLVSQSSGDLKIFLSPFEYELAEVIVRPKSPLYYIKEAIKQHAIVTPKEPFNANAYFMERTSLANDNSNSYQKDKAIFKIYFPNFSDKESDNQNQVVLHEFSEEGESKSILMENKRIKKFEAKQKKKNAKRAKKGEDIEEEEPPQVTLNLSDVGAGGPQLSLDLAQSYIEEPFFDEEYFKKFEYSFGEDTYYNGHQLMAIKYKNKKKIDHAFYEGTVYLDVVDLSIVAISGVQKLKIPFYINALIKTVAGFKLNSLMVDVSIKNQKHEGLWYPKEILADLALQIKQEDELEDLAIQQLLNIYEVKLQDVKEIPLEHRYDSNKELEEQIHNPDLLNWEELDFK